MPGTKTIDRTEESRPPVLLVEDNLDDERLVIRALRKAGVEDVLVARTGEEALQELLRGEPTGLSLVLLDLKLPKVNGIEVLRALRESDEGRVVPVVVFTSSDEEGDIHRSYELGANSYIRKPVDYDSFMDAVNFVVRYWLELNKAPASRTAVSVRK